MNDSANSNTSSSTNTSTSNSSVGGIVDGGDNIEDGWGSIGSNK
jgi:hypothetical protein